MRLARAALAAWLLAHGAAPAAADGDDVAELIRARLGSAPSGTVSVAGETLYARDALAAFYEARGHRAAWLQRGRSGPHTAPLFEALRGAAADGLHPGLYHLDAIESLSDTVRDAQGRAPDVTLARLDLLLSDAYLTLGAHLSRGRVDPDTLNPVWKPERHPPDLVVRLSEALEDGRVRASLDALRPAAPGYDRLRRALSRHRAIVAQGGWPKVPAGPTLEVGDRGPRVAALRARLASSGDLDARGGTPLYDERVERAVREFQARHGLVRDGVVSNATRRALNVPAARRLEQIRVNLERWRWLPAELGDPRVVVNIAGFELEVVESGRTLLEMRAIVGRPYRRTPVMSDRITYLVFSPAWHIPTSMAREDVLPRVRSDPRYLERNDITVLRGWGPDAEVIDPASVDWSSVDADSLPYRFRQEPGPGNALGRVKFMFPNPGNIYLHDTPERDLFSRESRDFSSGCIRIEKPAELAEYLLRDDDRWDRWAIEQAMQRGTEQTVVLPEPVPVHLFYWTAWVGDEGRLQFRGDVYGRDRPVLTALTEAAPLSSARHQ